MHRVSVTSLTLQQRVRLDEVIRDHVIPTVLEKHIEGHIDQQGVPFGEHFLRSHRELIGELEDRLRANNAVPLPYWNPATPIPLELHHPGRNTQEPNMPLPSWATIAGGNTRAPGSVYTSLLQFLSVGQLGEALAAYDTSVHIKVGGDMGFSEVAPRDPIFWLLHAFIDDVWWHWEHALSLKKVARDIWVTGDILILRDFFHNPPPPYQFSVAQKARELLD